MDTDHMAIALGDNHWSQQYQANTVIHPITGEGMEYAALMEDPHLQPLWARGFSKGFNTFQEPIHISSSNSLTSRKTEISLTAK
jgi:hypothetical protein